MPAGGSRGTCTRVVSRVAASDVELKGSLRRRGIRAERLDSHTIVLRKVPTSPHYFNKEHTNLIVARRGKNGQYVVCVDEDLEYHGEDRALARAFAEGPVQSGWRAIFLPGGAADLPRVIDYALEALGFHSAEPRLPSNQATVAERVDLDAIGVELAVDALEYEGAATVGRESQINAVVAAVAKWGQARLPVVVGEPGVGKTQVVQAAARKLKQGDSKLRVVLTDAASLFAGAMFPADREAALTPLLEEAQSVPGTILVLEHIDLVVAQTFVGGLLLARSSDAGLRMVGTSLPSSLKALTTGQLGRRLHIVRLIEPTADETVDILRKLIHQLSTHHGVEIDESCLGFCVSTARDISGCYPAKAIDLLDTACALASMSGAGVIGPDDIWAAARARDVSQRHVPGGMESEEAPQ